MRVCLGFHAIRQQLSDGIQVHNRLLDSLSNALAQFFRRKAVAKVRLECSIDTRQRELPVFGCACTKRIANQSVNLLLESFNARVPTVLDDGLVVRTQFLDVSRELVDRGLKRRLVVGARWLGRRLAVGHAASLVEVATPTLPLPLIGVRFQLFGFQLFAAPASPFKALKRPPGTTVRGARARLLSCRSRCSSA